MQICTVEIEIFVKQYFFHVLFPFLFEMITAYIITRTIKKSSCLRIIVFNAKYIVLCFLRVIHLIL